MAFSIAQYAKVRPTLWHLTHRDNLHFIRTSRTLKPADQLIPAPLDSVRRGRQVNAGAPVLRDQELLHEKCVALQAGFTFPDLLRELNRRVFFWSGWPDRPVKPGRDAIVRYSASDVLIRLSFLQLAKQHTPYFSRCNSGATRMQHGRRVLRGPDTFLEAEQCDFPPSRVVEVTFVEPVHMVGDCEVASSLKGPWEKL
jgi:hypothetical protein